MSRGYMPYMIPGMDDGPTIVEYRSAETGEFIDSHSLSARESTVAQLLTGVRNALAVGDGPAALELVVQAIRMQHPTEGEGAVLGYINRARDDYVAKRAAQGLPPERQPWEGPQRLPTQEELAPRRSQQRQGLQQGDQAGGEGQESNALGWLESLFNSLTLSASSSSSSGGDDGGNLDPSLEPADPHFSAAALAAAEAGSQADPASHALLLQELASHPDSVACEWCGGILAKARLEAHLRFWCEVSPHAKAPSDSDSDGDDGGDGAVDTGAGVPMS